MGFARMGRKRRRREVVRELMKATDKMISSGNVAADTMATLRADKVMLAQMLAQINEEPENEQ
jgi:soluble P-type ATPase